MKKPTTITLLIVLVLAALTLGAKLLLTGNFAVLNPMGTIAAKERALIITATLLMLVIVLPVFALTIGIAWKYRAGNTKATYTPDWDHNRTAETIWWGFPCLIIFVLSIITWHSTHELDPYRQVASATPAMTVQVVALDWKWLFIYPQDHIASVNYLQIPKDTPVNFVITSDAPMNSFWIPQLGGQVYAMAGMSTHLSLMATRYGTFNGSSANLSGAGFAGMRFIAKSTSAADFHTWVAGVKASKTRLTNSTYDALARPSQNNAPAYYADVQPGLYDGVLTKYMTPGTELFGSPMSGMGM